MTDYAGFLITWTTYGTWLPGDARGWRKRKRGEQTPQPLLQEWCRRQMRGEAVLLGERDRAVVEQACRDHCVHRNWELFTANARSNHVHVVVFAAMEPQRVRDQLKANCTRALRIQAEPLTATKTWSKGGDCSILPDESALEDAISYVAEGQDRTRLPG